MHKQEQQQQNPELKETDCPVHGKRSASATVAAPDLPETKSSKKSTQGGARKAFSPNILRDPLFWVALIISISVISAFHWLTVERMADRNMQSDGTWQKHIAGLSPSAANAMEWRLILDELKQKHVGVWPDPPIHSEMRAKVWRGKFYAYRNRNAEAVKTLESAFNFWQAHKRTTTMEHSDWVILCRLYNQNHEYAKTVNVFDKLVADDKYLRHAQRENVEFQRVALEAYEATGHTDKANILKAAIKKSSNVPVNGRSWEEGKDTKDAFCDMRFREYDYALNLLYEGKAKQAAARLQRIVRDEKAWRERSDNPQFRAKLIMMLAVANVAAENWDGANRVFPAALRLAEQQKFCPHCCNTKPTLYRAYARFLTHQGKTAEAAKYDQMAKVAQVEWMGIPGSDDPSDKNVFAKSDLYETEFSSD